MKMDTNEQNQQDKRELRHKRRQRNQIIAYTVVGIMILLLAVGIAFAVSKITSMSRNQEEQQNKVDEILSDEETIQAPTEARRQWWNSRMSRSWIPLSMRQSSRTCLWKIR